MSWIERASNSASVGQMSAPHKFYFVHSGQIEFSTGSSVEGPTWASGVGEGVRGCRRSRFSKIFENFQIFQKVVKVHKIDGKVI